MLPQTHQNDTSRVNLKNILLWSTPNLVLKNNLKLQEVFQQFRFIVFAATCILKANQSARFCLSNEITLVHGKFLTVQTVRIDLNWMHLPIHACLITKLTRWHCHSQNNRNYGNDAFKFKPCDCFPKAAESSLSTKENIFFVLFNGIWQAGGTQCVFCSSFITLETILSSMSFYV